MNLTLNPKYYLAPDRDKAILITYDNIRTREGEHIETAIHPVHAMVLCLCNGDEYEITIRRIVERLSIDEALVREFISGLYENETAISISFNNNRIVFPPKTLLNSDVSSRNIYDPEDFDFPEIKFSLDRRSVVSDITLMLNSNCKTDCVYCYADRKSTYKKLSVNQITSLIDQAKSIKVKTFDIIGGDVFAYPNWRKVIEKLYSSGYHTYLSTKVPLKEEDVKYLAKIGIIDIQVSLDSLIPEHLCEIVRRPALYVDQIKDTIKLLDQYGIKTSIHTIVCSKNATIKDMESVYAFVNTLDNVVTWKIDFASYSLYKSTTEFKKYKADVKDMEIIYPYLRSISNKNMTIMAGGIDMSKRDRANDYNSPDFYDKSTTKCTASYSHLFILPDGQVTVCEQMYWNPHFLVGDITKQTLLEIWNSPAAKRIFYIKREDISDRSICKNCEQFDDCRTFSCKVCWRDVVACYGKDNWDFPDPKCPQAPKPYYNVHICD